MVNVEFINPFVLSTQNVFKTMVFLDVVRGKPALKTTGEPRCDISGTIGLAGQANGVVAVIFSSEIACKICSNMLGEEFTKVNDTVQDSIGEIANMVAGGAKAIMTQKGLKFKIALPSVIVGQNHTISYPSNVPCMVVPFTIPTLNDHFSVEIALKTEK